MFDFGFSELLICGVIGLVVLGPEKLPQVAKTAGQLIGKAQRFVQQVKDDINKETDLAELKKIKEDAQNLARDLNSTVQEAARGIEKEVSAATGEAEKAVSEMNESLKSTTEGASGVKAGPAAGKSPVATSLASFEDSGVTAFGNDSFDDVGDTNYDNFSWKGTQPTTKIFDKRYRSGPSVDELAAAVEDLRTKLDMGQRKFTGSNRKYAVRARSNRTRIYR